MTEELKAIHKYCINCCGNSRYEAQHCQLKECPLYNYNLTVKKYKNKGKRGLRHKNG